MSAPSVYAASMPSPAELAGKGIAKTRTNEVDGYKCRSIDDVLDRKVGKRSRTSEKAKAAGISAAEVEHA